MGKESSDVEMQKYPPAVVDILCAQPLNPLVKLHFTVSNQPRWTKSELDAMAEKGISQKELA